MSKQIPLSGVLDVMVQQPCANAIDINGAVARYNEIWKGPYDAMRGVTAKGGTVLGVKWMLGYRRPTLNNNYSFEIGPPTTLQNYVWMVSGIQVQESNPPGDHAMLVISYESRPLAEEGTYSWYGWAQETSAAVSAEVSADNMTTWNCTWGTYSRNVLEYCSDNSITGDNRTEQSRILKCAQYPHPTSAELATEGITTDQQYYWKEPVKQTDGTLSVKIEKLQNQKEQWLYDRYVRGVQPVFHYPVITRSLTFYYPTKDIPKIREYGEGIDKKCDLPENCPFNFKKDTWEWLKVADDLDFTQDKEKKTVVWRTQWQGAWKWEYAFYGADCMKPGADKNQGRYSKEN